jgi:hypothetical protein
LRNPWENGLHDVKDVTLGEDRSTVHADNGPKIMAALRNTAVSLLRRAGFSTTPLEKRATLARPLSQNTSQPAQKSTGADITKSHYNEIS